MSDNNINITKLQNGSDIRGVALPGVPSEPVNLTSDVTRSISGALAVWICNYTKKNVNDVTIAIGHDSRLSGPDIKDDMISQLKQLGIKVLDAGLASTPAMFMSTVFPQFDCDAGVMITASHLPKNRNGFKFFTKKGGFDKGDIKDILSVANGLYKTRLNQKKDGTWDSNKSDNNPNNGTVEKINLMESYAQSLKDIIETKVGTALSPDKSQPLKGLHIVVDAGNGAGGFYATEVLRPLGANIKGSQFLEPDGNFPNHIPNPEDKEAMASIKKAVLDNDADLGIIFDTDVDRSSAVDSKGSDISRNAIVALAAALIADDHPGTTIVTDSITSTGLNKFLAQDLKLRHHRFKRGYKNVINESIRLNEEEHIDSQLAIETSGHAAFKENSFLDDGAYLATKIVIRTAILKAENKGIEDLIKDLKPAAEAEEFRFGITTDDYSAYGDRVLVALKDWASADSQLSIEEPNYEGIRINFPENQGNGWALLRKSLHDPIMPLNIESEKPLGVEKIGKILMAFLADYDKLDLSKLAAYLQ